MSISGSTSKVALNFSGWPSTRSSSETWGWETGCRFCSTRAPGGTCSQTSDSRTSWRTSLAKRRLMSDSRHLAGAEAGDAGELGVALGDAAGRPCDFFGGSFDLDGAGELGVQRGRVVVMLVVVAGVVVTRAYVQGRSARQSPRVSSWVSVGVKVVAFRKVLALGGLPACWVVVLRRDAASSLAAYQHLGYEAQRRGSNDLLPLRRSGLAQGDLRQAAAGGNEAHDLEPHLEFDALAGLAGS